MTATPADPAGAIATYLKTQLGSLVSDRVFRPKLPESENKHMPRGCIVVTPAGGYQRYGGSLQQLVDPRVQIRVYGSTESEADDIARSVTMLLRQIVRVQSRGARIDSVNVSGPMPLIDPDSYWPYSLLSAQVTMIEQTVV